MARGRTDDGRGYERLGDDDWSMGVACAAATDADAKVMMMRDCRITSQLSRKQTEVKSIDSILATVA